MNTRLDRLAVTARRWLHRLRTLGGPPADDETTPEGRLAAVIADRLQAESLPRDAALDVGLWGPAVYRSTDEAAARVRAVAVTGDELDLAS
jgi:hypothetical protein